MTNNYTQTGPYKLRMRTQYNIQMTMNSLALNEPHAVSMPACISFTSHRHKQGKTVRLPLRLTTICLVS